MDVLGITMFCKLELNPFNLGPFGIIHCGDCILVINRMIVYGFLSHPRNLKLEKG